METTRTTAHRWARSAALALTVGVAVSLTPSAASAAPEEPATAAQAADLVTRTGEELVALAERVAQAQATVDQQQSITTTAAAQASAAQAQLDALLPQLTSIAVSGGTSQSRLSVLLTSTDPGDLVQRLALLDVLADHADGVVADIAAAEDAATEAGNAALVAAAAAEASLIDLAAQREALEEQQAVYESDFGRLTATQQVRVSTSLSGPVMAAPTAEEAAATVDAAPSGAAAAAVATALDQVGDPYVTAGAGPDQFDCSGLTQYAYAAAGIDLPHSSRAQSQLGAPVARADLQPGDLVFFYSPVSHVGLYIGNGQMVHASVTGRPVAVTSVDKSGYAGARRVTG